MADERGYADLLGDGPRDAGVIVAATALSGALRVADRCAHEAAGSLERVAAFCLVAGAAAEEHGVRLVRAGQYAVCGKKLGVVAGRLRHGLKQARAGREEGLLGLPRIAAYEEAFWHVDDDVRGFDCEVDYALGRVSVALELVQGLRRVLAFAEDHAAGSLPAPKGYRAWTFGPHGVE